MSEQRPAEDVERRMEHDGDEMEERLHRLEDHIEEADHKAEQPRDEAGTAEEVAGDWEETRGTPSQGEDPEGAIDDGQAR